MKKLCLFMLLVFTFAVEMFGQGANGTITGTVNDPSGAVIPNASIQVTQSATGRVFPVVSTETGNYTIPQLPIGAYDLKVTAAGFKTYDRAGLDLSAAQVMRIDIPLEVGSQSDVVIVNAEASLLKTESGDLTHNVTVSQMNQLPILSPGGAGQGLLTDGWRDPFALASMIPGVQYGANNKMVINGNPDDTMQIRIEGMTSGATGSLRQYTGVGQPSVDAIQEVAVQTSNFAAEFGTVGGGIFNTTMKSGTSQFHGGAYDYAANEILNAYTPYTYLRSPTKRHDFGGTFGGPVLIPKLYNGKNKTFFFLNYEKFRENARITSTNATVPTDAYRNGDFSQVILGSGNANGPLAVQVPAVPASNGNPAIPARPYIDPLGRTYSSGSIFDPQSTRAITCNTNAVPKPDCSNGSTIQVRDQFPNNQIPISRFDPVSLNVLKLVPRPQGPNAASGQIGNNFQNDWISKTRSQIPSIKLDHTLNDKQRISFFYQHTGVSAPFSTPNGNYEGLPVPVTVARGSYVNTYTYRLNYDYTIAPTVLLHLGAGFNMTNFLDRAPVTDYDTLAELSLPRGTQVRQFPRLNVGSGGTGTGGMSSLGPAGQGTGGAERRPSGVANLSYVKGNHTYKVGGEWRGERYPTTTWTDVAGNYTFGSNSTQQTALNAVPLGQGTTGFAFASFLMGDVTGYQLAVQTAASTGKQQWGLYAQDTWKVSRKLTVDYGLRWDYGGYAREKYGRNGNFNPYVANASAGGHPGGQIFEATCNCSFAKNYPFAFGPRLGFAYQLDTRTVIRGGFGVVYTATGTAAGSTTRTANGATPGFGEYLGEFKDGIPSSVNPRWPVFDANIGQAPGTVIGAPGYLDQNAGRPARQAQWSIGIQREVTRDLVVEASYIGNRGTWWPANLSTLNSASVDLLSRYGFQVGNINDATLLTRQFGQLNDGQRSDLRARGVIVPYAGYGTGLMTGQTVRQSILPFPQYTGAINPQQAPLGNTWYDALQTNVTKRFSHGLSLNANYTFSKNLDLMSSPDIFNRQLGKNISGNDLPHQFRLTAEYRISNLKNAPIAALRNKVVSNVLGGWGIGWYMQYQSGNYLGRPASNSTNPLTQWLGRGPGTPGIAGAAQLKKDADGNYMNPYSVNWTDYDGKHHTDPLNINCHCFDPTTTQVLNPLAWTNVPDGQWASDYSTLRFFRGIRQPQENLNISRNFRIKEGISFNIRVEMSNVFNRTRISDPSVNVNFAAAPQTVQSGSNKGLYSAGFGTINLLTGANGARTGLFIGRLTF